MKKVFNFGDLKKTLFGGYSEKVHQMELLVDHDVKEVFLGKPITSVTEEVNFWYKVGYEYMPIVISAFGFAGAHLRFRPKVNLSLFLYLTFY